MGPFPLFWFGIYDTFPSDPGWDTQIVMCIPPDGDMSELGWANYTFTVLTESGEFYEL